MLTVTPLPTAAPTYVQVNIGRNVDDAPMAAAKWARFQSTIQHLLENVTLGRGVVSTHTGRGAWVDEHGVTVSEESAYISTFAVVNLDALREALAYQRTVYGQDAIALIVGSELI